MVQIECFNSEYTLNDWLRQHTQYCIRDIKPIVSTDCYHCRFMVIYEDNTQEVQEIIEKYKASPVQVFPDPLTSTSVSCQDFEGEYSVYLNG